MNTVTKNEVGGIVVTYVARPAELSMRQGEYFAICELSKTNPITAIKFVRAQFGLSLFDCKQIVDTCRNSECLSESVL